MAFELAGTYRSTAQGYGQGVPPALAPRPGGWGPEKGTTARLNIIETHTGPGKSCADLADHSARIGIPGRCTGGRPEARTSRRGVLPFQSFRLWLLPHGS